jgi:hypothetical protein
MLSRSLRKVRALAPPERRVAIEAGLLLPIAAAAIRCMSVDHSSRALGRILGLLPAGASVEPGRAARLVAAAGSRIGAKCLSRALVLHTILERRGSRTDLVIGAVRDAAGLRAHAWLEGPEGVGWFQRDGDGSYKPICRLGGRRQTPV